MRIDCISPNTVCEIPFLNAGRRSGDFYTERLPVHEAIVDQLPAGTSAIIATGDLQGRETFQQSTMGPPRLLGEVLPRLLVEDVLPELNLATGDIGVLLAGDFYTVPTLNKRGGSGDVTEVWRAFADEFDWVVGVAGNHDTFGDANNARPQFRSRKIHYLDGDRATIHGIDIAGLGGIIGHPSRLHRRSEDDYCRSLESLLEPATDILILHDGPDAPSHGSRGSSRVREIVEFLKPSLVVRGHSHWDEPFVELDGGVQILNVDARCVILRERR